MIRALLDRRNAEFNRHAPQRSVADAAGIGLSIASVIRIRLLSENSSSSTSCARSRLVRSKGMSPIRLSPWSLNAPH